MAIRPAATCIHEAAMTGPMNAIVGTETTIRSFEGARGLAALSVALFHFGLGEAAIVRIPAGYLFVDLFFVLSGFLICATYAHRLGAPGSLPLFLVRRIGRLLPLLLVATLAYVAMLDAAVLAHRLLEPDKPPPPLILPAPKELLATLTMTHSLGLFDHVILNYASWSISTEFYAYLVFALLCLLLRGRARLLAFAVVALAAWLVSAWASVRLRQCLHWGGCFDLTFDYGYWRCLAGFFLGALFSQLRPRAQPPGMLALVQGLAQGLALAGTGPGCAAVVRPAPADCTRRPRAAGRAVGGECAAGARAAFLFGLPDASGNPAGVEPVAPGRGRDHGQAAVPVRLCRAGVLGGRMDFPAGGGADAQALQSLCRAALRQSRAGVRGTDAGAVRR
jgi:peptidoglycan/LPS O-acetylase OafA/YrhL